MKQKTCRGKKKPRELGKQDGVNESSQVTSTESDV